LGEKIDEAKDYANTGGAKNLKRDAKKAEEFIEEKVGEIRDEAKNIMSESAGFLGAKYKKAEEYVKEKVGD
jgi:hypothetical protein